MNSVDRFCYANWPLVLEYLKVLLSGPPMAVLALGLTAWLFRRQVRDWLQTNGAKELEVSAAGATLKVKLHDQQAVHEPPIPAVPEPPMPVNDAAPAADLVGPDMTIAPEWADEPQAAQIRAYLATAPGPATGNVYDILRQLRFERLLQIIFGTQQQALEFLYDHSGPQPPQEVEAFHARHKLAFGDADASSFTVWVAFLIEREALVQVNVAGSPCYQLTTFGVKYVEYVRAFYPFKSGGALPG